MLSRDVHEEHLAQSLSRHIGYTTGAFSLERLADVTSLFPKASAYSFELIKHIQERSLGSKGLSETYATEVVNFSTALGLLRRLEVTGNPKLARFRLSAEALALRAANALNLDELRRLVLTSLLVENDADGYGLLLDLLSTAQATREREGQGLADRYLRRTKELREKRWEWLQRAFPQEVLRRRIAAKISWLRVPERGPIAVVEPKLDFGRHHSTPRKGWAASLHHASDETFELSREGNDLLEQLRGNEVQYQWVGPPIETIRYLKLENDPIAQGPLGPAWEIVRPRDSQEATEFPRSLVEEVVEFMRSAYPYLRLHHANQAPTSPVDMFMCVKERQLNHRISRNVLLETVFREYADKIAPLSSRTEKMAFYLVRKAA